MAKAFTMPMVWGLDTPAPSVSLSGMFQGGFLHSSHLLAIPFIAFSGPKTLALAVSPDSSTETFDLNTYLWLVDDGSVTEGAC